MSSSNSNKKMERICREVIQQNNKLLLMTLAFLVLFASLAECMKRTQYHEQVCNLQHGLCYAIFRCSLLDDNVFDKSK